ncbi:MAG: hypothetical protein ISS16_02670 [Ignavibacteria bacterium]|nr:hypothetical protein [Ignavibacteria bacterium]
MTHLLKKAFERASKLSDEEQNELAKWLISELEAERKWDKSYSKSEDILDKLADEALNEYTAGKTKPMDANLI